MTDPQARIQEAKRIIRKNKEQIEELSELRKASTNEWERSDLLKQIGDLYEDTEYQNGVIESLDY